MNSSTEEHTGNTRATNGSTKTNLGLIVVSEVERAVDGEGVLAWRLWNLIFTWWSG